MVHKLIKEGFIPYCKSQTARMGIQDLFSRYQEGSPDYTKDSIHFLRENFDALGDDQKALYRVLTTWDADESIDIGESGTLFRFLRFLSWKLVAEGKLKKPKEFIVRGTLEERAKEFCNDPDMINWPMDVLGKLDNETSQYMSIAAPLGNKEKVKNPPAKLEDTYDAIEHWRNRRRQGKVWIPHHDLTILGQADTYCLLMHDPETRFYPKQAEDYCFARAFGYISKKEGEKRWPSLKGHESNRIKKMETTLQAYQKGEKIISDDHRVVQAIAMLMKYGTTRKIEEIQARFSNPKAVNKTWPQFWKFLEEH